MSHNLNLSKVQIKLKTHTKVNLPLTTYYARHSSATIVRNIGISRDDIRAILGHRQDTVTDIYKDLDQERIDVVRGKLWMRYQPAQKWLKDRKGKSLEFDDILHYQKIIVALTESDRLMIEIDKIDFD